MLRRVWVSIFCEMPLDHPLQLAVSPWTIEQRVGDQARPSVGDPIQGLARFTVLVEDVGSDLVDSVRSGVLSVPIGTFKYLLVSWCLPSYGQGMSSLLIHRFHATGGGTPVNAYIVEGDSGAVVIDATLTVSDGRGLRARVAELGKPLLGVIVTHAHPDHYGGLDRAHPRPLGACVRHRRSRWSHPP